MCWGSDVDLDENKVSDDEPAEPSYPIFNLVEIFDPTFVLAIKAGFRKGCRKIIGVDWCHLKGPHGGILLTAVSMDPNNSLFPLSYAVVNRETKETWKWFLILLKQNLGIEDESRYVFMSDKQKGLIQAFQEVLPGAAHRFCVRHMHSNFKNAGFRVWSGLVVTFLYLWEMGLSGIPCKHVTSAIFNQKEDPEDYIDECYSVVTYKRVYASAIMLIGGENQWNESSFIPPLPQNFGRRSGRPSKFRRRDPDEPVMKSKKGKVMKLKRQQTIVKCSKCGQLKHNTRTCPNKNQPQPTGHSEGIEDLTVIEPVDEVFEDISAAPIPSKLNGKDKGKIVVPNENDSVNVDHTDPIHESATGPHILPPVPVKSAKNDPQVPIQTLPMHNPLPKRLDAPQYINGPSMYAQLQTGKNFENPSGATSRYSPSFSFGISKFSWSASRARRSALRSPDLIVETRGRRCSGASECSISSSSANSMPSSSNRGTAASSAPSRQPSGTAISN
ncbi:UNVERIFIED_CONTAM: hypothetical protein Sradi_0153000 [Sesamum radiatum]|uniref:MULE transposase domain-containing protein n=1 Tax=Sesamum radiatum TaxID=300843 RepID=A0AAW2WMZ1_SESRA